MYICWLLWFTHSCWIHSYVLMVIKETTDLSSFESSYVTFAGVLGMFIGQLLLGYLGDVIGTISISRLFAAHLTVLFRPPSCVQDLFRHHGDWRHPQCTSWRRILGLSARSLPLVCWFRRWRFIPHHSYHCPRKLSRRNVVMIPFIFA